MAKVSLAIAAAFLVAMTAFASAQGPSYESRGYGGPLYVGPNFQGGGQHSPPVYSPNSTSKERYQKKRAYKAKPRKDRDTTETAKRSPEKSGVKSENSSISRASTEPDATPDAKTADTTAIKTENSSISRAELNTETTSEKSTAAAQDEASPTRNVGCRKYFPTAGMTLSVPCE